jgi:hypothetical protein
VGSVATLLPPRAFDFPDRLVGRPSFKARSAGGVEHDEAFDGCVVVESGDCACDGVTGLGHASL